MARDSSLPAAHLQQHATGSILAKAAHAAHGHIPGVNWPLPPEMGGGGQNLGTAGAGCPIPGMRRDPVTGQCKFFLGDQPGPEPGGVGGGNAVMGRYGAALVPDVETRTVSSCLPGMVLGSDGLCYNRRDITNRERRWPKGRAPLLTGGERNAITKAARAAGKIKRTTKQLEKLGMLQKPRPRSAPKRLMAGPARGTRIVNIDND